MKRKFFYYPVKKKCRKKMKISAGFKCFWILFLFFAGAFAGAFLEKNGENPDMASVYKENRRAAEKNNEISHNEDNCAEKDNDGSYTEEELAQLRVLAEQENGSMSSLSFEDSLHIMVGDSSFENDFPDGGALEGTYTIPQGGSQNLKIIAGLNKKQDLKYLLKNFYIVNPTTSIDPEVFDVEKLLSMDCTMEKSKEPQILIFHTHGASEAFSDSRDGKKEDSVIGVGESLAGILSQEYGYSVIHDETPYDLIDGKIDRNQAYTVAENKLAKILEKYPSIQVMIDLHRDASSDGKTKRVTVINGKKCAQVMLFNGLSRNLSGDIEYLHNPNLQGNLGFSLQMKIKAMEYYEDFTLPIFLKGYRYSLHLREKSLLVELGNEVNTVKEAKNAMEPFAAVLDAVLMGK